MCVCVKNKVCVCVCDLMRDVCSFVKNFHDFPTNKQTNKQSIKEMTAPTKATFSAEENKAFLDSLVVMLNASSFNFLFASSSPSFYCFTSLLFISHSKCIFSNLLFLHLSLSLSLSLSSLNTMHRTLKTFAAVESSVYLRNSSSARKVVFKLPTASAFCCWQQSELGTMSACDLRWRSRGERERERERERESVCVCE